jgi:hypothetical protein
MEAPLNMRERPDVSAEERAAHELVQRILKLRWIGWEKEAEQMLSALGRDKPGVTSLAAAGHSHSTSTIRNMRSKRGLCGGRES